MTSPSGNYGLALFAAPAEEPLTLAEAKKQVEVATANTAHDTHLTSLIAAARQAAEIATNRQIITATWDLTRDKFPAGGEPLWLPFGRLQSVTHVKYTAGDGTEATWSSGDYVVSSSREPGVIRLAYGKSWPSILAAPDAVRVRFVCGYGLQASVPALLKAALLLMIGAWFEQREDDLVVPTRAADILQGFHLGDSYHNYA